jgi:hypothetical protein
MGGCWPTSGVLSALFGALLAVLAGSTVPFLAPLVGAFAVVVGLALIVFAFRLRERRRRMPTPLFLRFYVPASARHPPGWKSPRGNASLGDDAPPCLGLCSRASCRAGANKKADRSDVALDRHPTISEHGSIGDVKSAALTRWLVQVQTGG